MNKHEIHLMEAEALRAYAAQRHAEKAQEPESRMRRAERAIEKELEKRDQAILELLDGLSEITKREGPYKIDRLAHAESTIEHMAQIAEALVRKYQPARKPD